VIRSRRWAIAGVVAVTTLAGGAGIVSAATQAGVGCGVTFSVVSQWNTGFTANLTLKDTGSAAINGWTLRWSFPGSQQVAEGWNGNYSQSGNAVTVSNASWNGAIAPGATVTAGFNGSYSGSNPVPTAFTMNGVACTQDGAPPPLAPVPSATTSPPAAVPAPTAAAPTVAPTLAPTAAPTVAPTTVPPAAPAAPSGGGVLGTGRIQYGPTYTGDGTFYGATGEGNCLYEASSDRMIGAMNQQDYENSQACGAYLRVTGPNGKSLTIKVVDRCPECQPGDIDLSQEAFAQLAPVSAGRVKVSWQLLSPALSGPVSYKYKDGSSQYWCGIQVRNHRNPVRSLELKVNGAWKSVPRLEYNYFVSADGSGCGSDIRITDIYGNQLTDTGITISPNAVQPGKAQFGPPK
jgi:expansin (peptidoglycan-binding protein)